MLPQDVAPLIGRVLDPTLFDVGALIKNGDDDAHRSFLPLIVQDFRGGRAAAAAMSPVSRPSVILPSIGAAAVREPRADAAREGASLAQMALAVLRARRVTPAATRGVRYIWLDQTVRALGGAARPTVAAPLRDHYLTQIGAPIAWRNGDEGDGVRVAVLDTGVEAAHPDLRGQVVAVRNFTGEPGGVTDKFGHGTFVAAEIAGTGRASGGERRGVAFGARLVIGKVLGNDGTGLESWLMAGMEWAATRAKVISMSLGGLLPSDGTDPLSQAVNRLTAAHHVLFVIAAGNSGPADETVTSPGAAADALTVGAVDGSGRLAYFSSRGPEVGTFAIKPEIVAPGVNIAGARASGTTMGTPLSAWYVIDSGTSMATPLVAGSAAILAALHPTWDPAQLKADLVATAHPASGGDIYELGGGQLNIGTAVTDTIVAHAAVADLGTAGDGATRPIRSILSWTNTGKRAVTLDLSASLSAHSGAPAPSGTLTLSTSRIQIPPGGTAAATLVLRPGLLGTRPGLFEGVAVASAGQNEVRTLVRFYLRPHEYTLTVQATPLPGTAPGYMAWNGATVVDASDPDVAVFSDIVGPVKVPVGHYWIIGEVDDLTPGRPERSAITGQPDVNVSHDTTVTLNGAASVPVTASAVGHPTLMSTVSVHEERQIGGVVYGTDVYADLFNPVPVTRALLYAQPTGTSTVGSFRAYAANLLVSPPSSRARYLYDLYRPLGGRIPASVAYVVTPGAAARLARVTERFYAIDGNTTQISDTRYGLTASGFLAVDSQNGTEPSGTVRTDCLSASPYMGWDEEVGRPLPFAPLNYPGAWAMELPAFVSYPLGSRQVQDWAKQPFRPGPYSGASSVSLCAPLPVTRDLGYIHVELVDLQDLPDGFDCLGGATPLPGWPEHTSRVMRLYLARRLLGTSRMSVGTFAVPARAASYQLTYADNTSQALPVSTQTSTTWTFQSAAPVGTALVRIPLLVVDYSLPLNLDNRPDGYTAMLTVRCIVGPRPAVTAFRVWTSTTGGHSWLPALVRSIGGGRFAVILPQVAKGVAVSLRVSAITRDGRGIDQTILTAYHG